VQVIAGAVEPAELQSKFNVAINLHREAIVLTSTSGRSSSAQNPPPGCSNSNPDGAAVAASVSDRSTNSQPEPTLEERIERAKQLAAAKQQQKREEEAEVSCYLSWRISFPIIHTSDSCHFQETKRRENERREAGKKVAELKRWQDEQETKRLADERRKDKQEEAALRQRLREQIAQDRIDRETRARANQGTEPASTAPSKVESPAPTPSNYTGLARLQFRLPDGSTHTHAFEPESTLGGIRTYLVVNVAVPPQ